MAFKMKGFSGFKKTDPPKRKKSKGFDIKGYLKGEQGLIPDYKGKSTKKTVSQVKKRVKKAANESTFLNPKSADEVISDRFDSQMYTASMKQDRKDGKKSKMTQFYEDKSKKTRPNRKDRY